MGMVSSLRRSLVLAGVIAAVLVAASVSGAAKVDPVLLTGASNQGKDCSDNQGDQTWTQLKVDPNADGTYTDGTLTVTISNTQDDKTFDWSSNIGVDAVIVKGGDDGSYLYRYDPPSEETSDTGLTTPGQNAISHVNFCYDVEAPPAQGSLTVIKHVDNSKGGSASAGDFQMNVAGPTPLSFAGAESPGTTNSVDPGAYTVTESGGPSDYALTYSGDCDSSGHVTVAADQTATCTLTNTGQAPAPGKIIVEKDTIPFEAEPPAGAFIFTGDITANLLPGQSASEDVAPGTYTVSEDISKRPFWDLGSIKCDDSDSTGDVSTFTATYHVSPGETVKCVFTNIKRGEITVVKRTVPAGAATSFHFVTNYDSGGFSLHDGQQNVSGPLKAGETFSVSENVPSGWVQTSATCDNGDSPDAIHMTPFGTPTCTFVNTKAAHIIVKKVMVGGTDSFDFSGMPTGTISESGGTLEATVVPGQYTSTEAAKNGWDLSSISCDDEGSSGTVESRTATFDVQAGQTVTCTFTNTKQAQVIVKKVMVGGTGSFDFSGTPSGTISQNGGTISANVEPGQYTSTEATKDGWDLTSVTCDDENSSGDLGDRTATFDVQAGETVTCTFTNTKKVVVVGQGSISVSKSADPTSMQEPGGPVTFSVRITNTSNVDVVITNVVDDKFGDLDDDGGSGCFDVPITLHPAGFASCQFTKPVTGPGGTTHIDTVTASGHDVNGHDVSASDSARVDITPKLIDLVIVKDATSPTPLNGNVQYTMTVTNKGPDTATNVQLADPAPAGITYLSASSSQGTCTVTPVLITCSLGSLAAGQTVTVHATGKSTSVGSHTNTATVIGSGGRETNPADNVDTAVTVTPAPIKPPKTKPTPKPTPEPCMALTVTPKMIKADGKPDAVVAKVTAGKKHVKGAKVLIQGAGVRKSGRTNNKGTATIKVNPQRAGLITISTPEVHHSCGPRRIGVVGVFLPPVTG